MRRQQAFALQALALAGLVSLGVASGACSSAARPGAGGATGSAAGSGGGGAHDAGGPQDAAGGGASTSAGSGGTPGSGGAGGAPVGMLPGWTLIWSDEFDGPNGSDVDPTKWIHDVGDGSTDTEGVWNPGYGWGNDELEYYTPGTANTEQRDGNLVITAKPSTDPSYTCYFLNSGSTTSYHPGTCKYTSGRIRTLLGPVAGTPVGPPRKDLFSHLYGRFEMRAQIPPSVGLWPAFWTMGTKLFSSDWPTCGELDIMEVVGDQPSTVYGTSHSQASGDTGITHMYTLPGSAKFSDAFHVYAMEWSATSLAWYVDGTLYGTETAPAGATTKDWPFSDPANPFFIILNLAVSSGDANSWGAAPNAATPFPAELKVDYVRVYEANAADQ
jgi:hypothetical protein